jgi:hypothetical protein
MILQLKVYVSPKKKRINKNRKLSKKKDNMELRHIQEQQTQFKI